MGDTLGGDDLRLSGEESAGERPGTRDGEEIFVKEGAVEVDPRELRGISTELGLEDEMISGPL